MNKRLSEFDLVRTVRTAFTIMDGDETFDFSSDQGLRWLTNSAAPSDRAVHTKAGIVSIAICSASSTAPPIAEVALGEPLPFERDKGAGGITEILLKAE